MPITIIENTTFHNNFGDSGASISFFRGGGLFCKSCEFYLDDGFGDPIKRFVDNYDGGSLSVQPSIAMITKSSIIKNNYGGNLPLKFLVDDEFLDKFIDNIVNKDGQIALDGSKTNVKNANTPLVAYNMTRLFDFIDSEFDGKNVLESHNSALSNSLFRRNVGQTSSAMSLYSSNLDLISSKD